jgi:hypothetical protein
MSTNDDAEFADAECTECGAIHQSEGTHPVCRACRGERRQSNEVAKNDDDHNVAHNVRATLHAVRLNTASYDGRKGHMKKALVRARRRLGKALARGGGLTCFAKCVSSDPPTVMPCATCATESRTTGTPRMPGLSDNRTRSK